MAKQKQHVFSARTTEEGLRLLNQLKAEKGIGWDGLVIDAVCSHYGLERAVMSLPKKEAPAEKGGNNQESAGEGEHKQAKGQRKGQKAKAAEQQG